MYSILLTVKKPDESENQASRNYFQFLNVAENLSKQNKDCRLLAENTILLPLNKGLRDVADVVSSIRSLPYTYTILTEDTLWYSAEHKI